MRSNTATNASPPPGCIPVKCVDGTTACLRIIEMRAGFHDFIIEVYPPRKLHGIVQIGGEDYFYLERVKRNFRADCLVDVDLKTYEQWNTLMGRMIDLYNERVKP